MRVFGDNSVEVLESCEVGESKFSNLGTLMLVAAPTLAAFGPLLPVVPHIYAFRVIVAALLFATLISRRGWARLSAGGMALATTLAFAVWLLSGFVAGLLASDKSGVISDALAVCFGMAFVLAIMLLWDAATAFRWLVVGWAIAFAATSVVSILELTAHIHMSNYVLAPYLRQGRGEELSASTFGNPNAYALFLAMSVPVLLYLATVSTSKRIRALAVLCILWLFVMLVYTGGRIAIVATAACVLTWLCCTRKAALSGRGVVIAVGLLLLVTVNSWRPLVASADLPSPPQKLGDFSASTVGEVATSTQRDLNSGNVRYNLMLDGWDMVRRTRGIGVGPGNFPDSIRSHGESHLTGGVLSPHNAVFEIASQWGLLALLAIVALFGLVVARSIRKGLFPQTRSDYSGTLVLLFAAGFPLYAICSSTFWTLPTTWVFLAFFLLSGSVVANRRAVQHVAPPV